MSHTCIGCKRSFRTAQGLGLHWDHARKGRGQCRVMEDTKALVDADVGAITAAIRAADVAFESTGGSSRHYVRECLLPEFESRALRVVKAQP